MFYKNLNKIINISKRNFSALYLTGDKAKENYAVLTPYFDFKNILQNRIILESNISNRKLNYDLNKLYKQWQIYQDVQRMKSNLERRKIEIADFLSHKDNPLSEGKVVALKTEGKAVREDIKKLKEGSYALEDEFIHYYLQLPNHLHGRTSSTIQLISSYLDVRAQSGGKKSHLEIDQSSIEYIDPTTFYLNGDAAKFDILLPFYCNKYFKENGFIQFSNPDFVRSVIAEGAGFDPSLQLHLVKEEVEHCKINLLHLAGNGSMLSFLGFITKMSIYPTILPLSLIAAGKTYMPIGNHESDIGLYATTQATTIQTFNVTENQEKAEKKFDELLTNFIDLYRKFDNHFKVVYVPAYELNKAESLKASIQMFSPFLNNYIEIGNLCYYGDYISKRLLFNYRDGKEYKFPHIISGTVANIPKLIAVIIENNNSVFQLPSFLREC